MADNAFAPTTEQQVLAFVGIGLTVLLALLSVAPRLGGWLLVLVVLGMLLTAHRHGYV